VAHVGIADTDASVTNIPALLSRSLNETPRQFSSALVDRGFRKREISSKIKAISARYY
jgi:hypothetical protein